jgi:hypothetical protein
VFFIRSVSLRFTPACRDSRLIHRRWRNQFENRDPRVDVLECDMRE